MAVFLIIAGLSLRAGYSPDARVLPQGALNATVFDRRNEVRGWAMIRKSDDKPKRNRTLISLLCAIMSLMTLSILLLAGNLDNDLRYQASAVIALASFVVLAVIVWINVRSKKPGPK
uniref:Uncharacterized protein n=1 Tax=Aquisalinus luteolus TaxID=1566827 RepID=A0A8J3A482_9PROT|nr:hypothetical protein GCM10011355_23520 [Aquisalinus luteolus]